MLNPSRVLSTLTLVALGVMPVAAQATETAFETDELIVLLDANTETVAKDVAPRERLRRALPKTLANGPLDARFLIQRRSQGAARERLLAEPDSPAALLESYLVLRYPSVVDTDAIARDLRKQPNVLFVRPNHQTEVSAVLPNDPLFGQGPPPDQHQWGSHLLNLPDAWERTTGHGYVGVLDHGIDTSHPDLAMMFDANQFIGGNFRPQLSHDYGYDEPNVDEAQPQVEDGALRQVALAGHGTHVAGIVAASPDNNDGVAGVCWDCSLVIAKASKLRSSSVGWVNRIYDDGWIAAWHGAVDRGAQVLNLSLGKKFDSPSAPNCIATPLDPFCVALEFGLSRDVLTVAAAGNDGKPSDWPADEAQVFGAGGLQADGAFWNDCPGGDECGSNIDANQFNTPAKDVLSTFYRGLTYAPVFNCDDSLLPGFPGWGPCTGTSMSSPYLAGSLALIRSTNPLLQRADVESILLASLDNPPGWNTANGHGKPDVDDAVARAIGANIVPAWTNRLTPLFNLWSPGAEAHLSTTVPQQATAALNDSEVPYFTSSSHGDQVPGYNQFPGSPCQVGPCINLPRAWVHLFTTSAPPFAGAPPLVPLYRLSYDGPNGGNATNRSFTYTTERTGVKLFSDVGYQLDGIEGYLYPRCTPEPSCIPTGAARLYRLYHFGRDDYAIFPESKLAQFQADGYVSQSTLNDWIGYVYENIDSDGDTLIDGYETVVGSNPNVTDSDCDGTSDGAEVLGYPYSDPLDGSCSSGIVIAEVGSVTTLRHIPQTIVLSRTYTTPVVIAQPASFRGSHQSVVRITEVERDRFTMYIHEAPDQDGGHTTETVSYIVIEAGQWRLADGTLLEAQNLPVSAQVGRAVANTWHAVALQSGFAEPPVVLTQVATNANPAWIKTRQANTTTSGFQVALEAADNAIGAHGTETVGVVAIQGTKGSWSGHGFEAQVTSNAVTHLFHPIQYSTTHTQVPHFIAALATYDGGDGAHLRFTNATTSGVEVKVEEETTYDAETNHTTEAVSYIAIAGSGQLEGKAQ